MSKVLISYFSFTGKTLRLAEAVAEGARSAGADVDIREVAQTTLQDVGHADAWLVATPQTFGTMAAETKRLFERLWLAKNDLASRPAFGAVICHAKQPVATLELLNRFATLFGLSQVQDTLTVDVAQIEDGLVASRRLGVALAEAAKSR